MVKVLFASNNVIHFPTASASATVGKFDTTRVPYAIHTPTGQILTSPIFSPSDTEDTWFHFRYTVESVSFSVFAPIFSAYDASNRLLFSYYKSINTLSRAGAATLYNGSNQLEIYGSVENNPSVVNNIDIHYKTNILGMEVKIYVNNTLSITISFASNPNNYGKPISFRMGPGMDFLGYFSEILVANGDTRNARLNLLRPTASGAYDDWNGAIFSLIDEDLSTGLSTVSPDVKHSLLLSPYVGSTNISNVTIVSNTTRGINSPTKLKHLMRYSAVDYLSPDIPIANTLQYNITDNEINPATSLPWVSSDLSSIETGFVSVA